MELSEWETRRLLNLVSAECERLLETDVIPSYYHGVKDLRQKLLEHLIATAEDDVYTIVSTSRGLRAYNWTRQEWAEGPMEGEDGDDDESGTDE